jgi:pimeloyl-ACP methyl ester carboxylesterase
VILYFGGNAEDVLYTAASAPVLNARRMLVVNYRGYGRSTGKPGQKALYDDALAIYQHAVTAGDATPAQIVVMGRSLGSGVAAMLAAQRPVGGAILVTPFDSLGAVAARHYSFMPVRLLLRHPFPSVEWAQHAKAPALILAGERDHIIPPVHAQRLHDAWAGNRQIHILEGVGHNDIELNPEYHRLINQFLEAVGG